MGGSPYLVNFQIITVGAACTTVQEGKTLESYARVVAPFQKFNLPALVTQKALVDLLSMELVMPTIFCLLFRMHVLERRAVLLKCQRMLSELPIVVGKSPGD
uniref:Uncharacterized protein n=1 Tax=Nelumbo nucifera TaxID=4432 RepID=A0A822Z775_NELNU|nr:TPA_asm: hypothetical protein HUJ06_013628 [Nelumbo nucifera]